MKKKSKSRVKINHQIIWLMFSLLQCMMNKVIDEQKMKVWSWIINFCFIRRIQPWKWKQWFMSWAQSRSSHRCKKISLFITNPLRYGKSSNVEIIFGFHCLTMFARLALNIFHYPLPPYILFIITFFNSLIWFWC